MACSISTIISLIKYGNLSPENKAKLEVWLENAINQVGEGNGSQIISASANGASFTTDAGGMTNLEWFNCLTMVLEHINNGTFPQSISIARI